MQSIRERQKVVLLQLLDFNRDAATTSQTANTKSSHLHSSHTDSSVTSWSDEWKVLVYDKYCRDIISPILTVQDLRTKGVTLHLLLETSRERIADVPAVYFVLPTADNVRLIAEDCSKKLYDKLHLNFAGPLPRPLLESLARSAIESDAVRQISSVHQQHLKFVSLEHNLFSLNQSNSFTVINDPTLPDTTIEAAMSDIAHSLLAVCICLGTVPIVRFRPGGPGEAVGRQLVALLREETAKVSSLSSSFRSGAFQRPLLLLVDRQIDLAVTVAHTSSYQALVDDLLGCQSNRVTVPSADKGGKEGNKTFDLDADHDPFWKSHAASPFPEAIAANGAELEEVTQKEEAVRRTAGASTQADAEAEAALMASGMSAPSLAEAVDSLPALLNRKKMLNMHLTILKAAMNQIAAREIPTYFDLEQQLANGTADRVAVLDLLKDPHKGHLADKLRLAQVFLLRCKSGTTNAELEALEKVFLSDLAGEAALGGGAGLGAGEGNPAAFGTSHQERENAVAVLRWLHKHLQATRAVASMMTPSLSATPASGPASGNATDKWSSGLSFFSNMAGKVTDHAVDLINKTVKNVKSFLPTTKHLPVTQLVRAHMTNSSAMGADSYVTIDPKLSDAASRSLTAAGGGGAGMGAGAGAAAAEFTQSIVFVVGGGNYTEYQNLQDFANSEPATKRGIVYGCTELLSPEAFQAQLMQLAGVTTATA